MKRLFGGISVGIALLGGCGDSAPRSDGSGSAKALSAVPESGSSSLSRTNRGGDSGDRVIAQVGTKPMTMRELEGPLVEAHGLSVLLNMVQLELARQDAAQNHVLVSPQDIQTERDQTLLRLFRGTDEKMQEKIDEAVQQKRLDEAKKLTEELKQDHERLLDQFLAQQNVSRPEFDLVLQTNAYLRKIAEPKLEGKITDEALRQAFNQTYGETVSVRFIQCANAQQIAEAKRQIASGKPFARVAQEMSNDPVTARMGGELPRFSRQTPGYPEEFKKEAFSLQPGQVSEVVQSGNAFYLIKLEARFQPKAVKFENVKESLRTELYERLTLAAIKELREQLAQQALQMLKIEDPVLKKQFARRMDERTALIRDQEKARREMAQQRQTTTQPQRLTTEPFDLGAPDPAATTRESSRRLTLPSTQPQDDIDIPATQGHPPATRGLEPLTSQPSGVSDEMNPGP